MHAEGQVPVLAADELRLAQHRPELTGLVIETPERRADGHRGQFAARVLIGPGHAAERAIFLREARVEHAAKVDVSGRAAGADDDGFAGSNAQDFAVVVRHDTQHTPGIGILPDDRIHPVLE